MFSACQSPVDYAGLATGNHSFKVRAVDAAGNRDPSPASRGFKVDLTRANTTITARPPQTVVPDSTQELRFESDDPGSTFECRLGGSAFGPCSSPWSISVNAPGNYSGEVRAIGSNGQPDPTPAGFMLHAAEPEQRCGTLAHDETWSTDNLSGIVLTCSVNVPAGVKLEIDAGVFVKSEGGAIQVQGGTLEASGTASEPVIFTSLADDSVGGDTGGDNGTVSPSAGEAAGIYVGDESVATLDGTTIRYAATALDVADGGEATVHGEIINSTVGVRSDTFVDATEVDWGDPSGPAPIGSGTPIEGDGVFVLPWAGYVEPSRPPYSPGPTLEFNDCRKFFVIGARGSGEAPQGDPPVYSDNADGFGSRAYDAFYGFKDFLSSYGYNDSDFKLLGLRYRALGVVFNPINFGTDAYFDSIYEGVDHLIDALYDQSSKCPSQRAVLVGYSQGALVIHLALRQLQDSDPAMLNASHIAGVMLVADPAKIAHGSETVWEDENTEAAPGSGVDNADGIWTHANLSGSNGGLPSAVTDRTISFCHDNDIVCAPGFGSSTSVHTSFYTASVLNEMGRWMAKRVLGLN